MAGFQVFTEALTWLFTDVVHGGLLPKAQSMHNGNQV
jgi:hypothetical protein